MIKTHKKGRLKSFKNRSDAVTYATTRSKQSLCNHGATTTAAAQELSNFKALTTQELIVFKRFIEAGDLKTVKDMVWENPRYLISSGDTPALLQVNMKFISLYISKFH